MVDLQRALILTRAFWQFVFCVLWYVIAIHLSFMAWLTEMSWAPKHKCIPIPITSRTKLPNYNRTCICTRCILYHASRNSHPLILHNSSRKLVPLGRTLSSRPPKYNVIFEPYYHCSLAVLSASKVGFLALEALIIAVNCHGVLLRLIVVRVFRTDQSLIFLLS
jgi:hypothetical protein